MDGNKVEWSKASGEFRFITLVMMLNAHTAIGYTPKEWARIYMHPYEPNSSDKTTTNVMLNYLYYLGYVSKTPQYNIRVDGNNFAYRAIKKIPLRSPVESKDNKTNS